MTQRTLMIFANREAARQAGFTGSTNRHRKDETLFFGAMDDLQSLRGLQFSHMIISQDAVRHASPEQLGQLPMVKASLRLDPMILIHL